MSIEMQKNIPLREHTTLKAGGEADYFVSVENVEQLKQALRFAQQNAVLVYVLGGGSNILFPSAGFRGLVIKNAIKGLSFAVTDQQVHLTAGAGEGWDELVETCVAKEYWGLENLSAIPGTVGATPIQNVGAYGVEVSHLISAVECIHQDTLEQRVFTVTECDFGYRDSFFKSPLGRKWIVVRVVFLLTKNPQPVLEYTDVRHLKNEKNITAKKIRDEVIKIRSAKFPDWQVVGTAGSFFKNPIVSAETFWLLKKDYADLPGYETPEGDYKISLGWVLDKALHLKGYSRNHVRLFEAQALVLVSEGGSSDDIEHFYKEIQSLVKEKVHITIEPEVQIIKNK